MWASSVVLGFLNPLRLYVHITPCTPAKMMIFPFPFSFPYTKEAPSLFPMLLTILNVLKLHTKGCDV